MNMTVPSEDTIAEWCSGVSVSHRSSDGHLQSPDRKNCHAVAAGYDKRDPLWRKHS